MENAVKALEISSGVFLGLLILGALVLGYNRVSELRRTQYEVEQDQQSADFNKSYEAYNTKSVYGSEIFSLANKVVDYNKAYPAEEGYEELILAVTFTKDYGAYFQKNMEYTATSITAQYETIAKKIRKDGSNEIKSSKTNVTKKVQEWSKVSSSTLNSSFVKPSNEYKAITDYKQLTNVQNDIVRTTFKCIGYDYDTNGKITKMSFVEN